MVLRACEARPVGEAASAAVVLVAQCVAECGNTGGGSEGAGGMEEEASCASGLSGLIAWRLSRIVAFISFEWTWLEGGREGVCELGLLAVLMCRACSVAAAHLALRLHRLLSQAFCIGS